MKNNLTLEMDRAPKNATAKVTFLPAAPVYQLRSGLSPVAEAKKTDVTLRTPRINREVLAGVLLVVTVGIIGGIVLLFAEDPELFRPTYGLTVEFSDASGLTKGSDVFLSGVLIGKVVTNPQPVPGQQKVKVDLKIDQNVQIRQNAQLIIEDQGILGDEFVNVRPQAYDHGHAPAPYFVEGQIVQGERGPDAATLMAATLPLIHHANHLAAQVDGLATELNTDVLTDKTLANLKDVRCRAADIVDQSNDLAESADGLIANLKAGHGVLGELLYDRKVKSNLAGFMANLKADGPFFYTDDAQAPDLTKQVHPPWRARP